MDHSRDIAVIGAGIMGLSAAHALRAHHKVTLFDQGGRNASSMAGGMLAPYAEIDYLPGEYLNAALAGLEFWQRFPGNTGFERSGSLLLAHKEDTHMLERFAHKLPGVSYTDAATLEPALAKFGNGIYLKDEAHLNPALALQALAEGLNIRRETADIEKIRAEFGLVIDCCGLSANDPDLRGVKGESITVRNPEFTLSRPVRLMHPRYSLYIVPRPGHEFMIGATLIETADDHVTLRSGLELLSAAWSLNPSFAEAEIVSMQAGIRPAYPDNLPRISIDGNVIRSNGLFRHGYLLAPVMAACVADYIAGQTNQFMHLFRRETHDDSHRQRPEKELHRAA